MKDKSLNQDNDKPPGGRAIEIRNLKIPEESCQYRVNRISRRILTQSAFIVSPAATAFRKSKYPFTTQEQWNDWHWQYKNRIKTIAELERIIELSSDERQALMQSTGRLPFSVTPYYMSLIDALNPNQGLRRTVIPVTEEYARYPEEAEDPLGETGHSPVEGIIHRYPDRVLLLAAEYCFTHCRYCTRSRIISDSNKHFYSRNRMDRALEYIEQTPAIRDVLLSGGDPLVLSDYRLELILKRLKTIKHVEIIRIGTKVPAVLPQRITLSLIRMLKKFHPLWMSVHFTHPDELTPETENACTRLVNAGIPLGSQTVLLKGINDNVETLRKLFHGLLKMRVRPYYLYQCDPILGSAHFRTPVERGIYIIEGLRGHTSGYAVPTYVIDTPGGGGKIAILPNQIVGRDGDDLLLKNYMDRIYRYPDSASRGFSTAVIGNCLNGEANGCV